MLAFVGATSCAVARERSDSNNHPTQITLGIVVRAMVKTFENVVAGHAERLMKEKNQSEAQSRGNIARDLTILFMKINSDIFQNQCAASMSLGSKWQVCS